MPVRRMRSLAVLVAIATTATGGVAYAQSAGCSALAAQDWDFSNVTAGSITVPRGPFDVGDIIELTVSGTSGTARVMDPPFTTAVISINVTASVQTQTYQVPTAGTYTLSVLSPVGFTSSARCLSPPTPSSGASESYDRAVTKAFLLSRINGMLLNSPASTSILTRQLGPRGAPAAHDATPSAGGTTGTGAMNLGGNPVLAASRFDDDQAEIGSQPIQFRTSLSSMRAAARDAQMERDRMALGAGDGGALPLAFEGNSSWDVWAEGRYSGFSDDTANLGRDGHVGLLFVGTDYRITPDIIVGGLMQWDWSKDEADAITTKVDGTGWMLGPYVSARVHENVYVDLRAAWGSSWNDLNAGATSASFDTTRWLVKGTVSGNWMHDAWRITPSAELAYVEESQEAFTNSAGVFVAGQDVSLGRLQFGPEVGYRFAHTPQLLIEPFAAIKGVWDWDNPNVAIIDGFVVGPGDFWGRLEGGLNVLSTDGTVVRGLASWDGVGADDYSGFTLQGIANVPLT